LRKKRYQSFSSGNAFSLTISYNNLVFSNLLNFIFNST